MKNQKNERGITLVALVVTIVVLLILAGITIMYVMQGDSIFNSAKDAKSKTNLGVVQEVVSSAILDAQSAYYTDKLVIASGSTADVAMTKHINDYIVAAGMNASNLQCTMSDGKLKVSGTVNYKDATDTYTVALDQTSETDKSLDVHK